MNERRDRAWAEAMEWVFDLDRHPHDHRRAADLERWLGEDPAHATAYEQARLIWDAAPHLAPAPSNVTTLPARPSRRRFLAGGGALAAGVALAWAGRGHLQNWWADYSTSVGETLAVDLGDGTGLTLNTDSAVSTVLQDGNRRIDLLRGEVFITAPARTRPPLEMLAGGARVVTPGGGLNLRRDGGIVRVALAHGEARLFLGSGRQETLPPDIELSWNAATGAIGRSAAPAHLAAWRDGRLIVEHWPVSRVLDEISRYHPGTIVLADRALGARTVNGVYDLTRPIDATRAVVQAFGGKVTEITPYVLVVAGA